MQDVLSGGSIVALDVISELHLACHVTGGLPYYKKLVGVIVVPLLYYPLARCKWV